MGVGGSVPRPGCLYPRKDPVPIVQRLGGPQGRSGRAENLGPIGIRSRTVQPVVSRYTDWGISHKTFKFWRGRNPQLPTAALEGVEWPAARPGRTLPPGKTRYPFYRRLGGPQGRSGTGEKSRPHRDSILDRPARSQYFKVTLHK